MKEFIDRVPSEGKANRKKITYSDNSTEYVFIENADEPETGEEGTAISRNNMMALQGFISNEIEVTNNNNNEKVIIETNADNHTLTTTFYSDGSIKQIFVGGDGRSLTKNIKIENGKIIEEMENVRWM